MKIGHHTVKIFRIKNRRGYAAFCCEHLTHAPESHGCKPVDEWLSVRGSAPRRNPEKKGATAVKPWGSTEGPSAELAYQRLLKAMRRTGKIKK